MFEGLDIQFVLRVMTETCKKATSRLLAAEEAVARLEAALAEKVAECESSQLAFYQDEAERLRERLYNESRRAQAAEDAKAKVESTI
jgi:hypothetical protein